MCNKAPFLTLHTVTNKPDINNTWSITWFILDLTLANCLLSMVYLYNLVTVLTNMWNSWVWSLFLQTKAFHLFKRVRGLRRVAAVGRPGHVIADVLADAIRETLRGAHGPAKVGEGHHRLHRHHRTFADVRGPFEAGGGHIWTGSRWVTADPVFVRLVHADPWRTDL